MINPSVVVTGYVVASQVMNPKKCFDLLDKDGNWGKKFQISIDSPHHKQLVEEITQRIEAIRREQPLEHTPDYRYTYDTDTITDKKGYLAFETICEPKLFGLCPTEDGDLLYKHITLLGHIKFHKGGNAYLSFHEIRDTPPEIFFDDKDYDGLVDHDF